MSLSPLMPLSRQREAIAAIGICTVGLEVMWSNIASLRRLLYCDSVLENLASMAARPLASVSESNKTSTIPAPALAANLEAALRTCSPHKPVSQWVEGRRLQITAAPPIIDRWRRGSKAMLEPVVNVIFRLCRLAALTLTRQQSFAVRM